MRHRLAPLFALAVVTAMSGHAQAGRIDTIDCQVDLNASEQTICDSQRLQILDAKITQAYVELITGRWLAVELKDAVRESQHVFLKRRNACGSHYACLEDIMGQRLTRIGYYR
jgi:uncharacterized protein